MFLFVCFSPFINKINRQYAYTCRWPRESRGRREITRDVQHTSRQQSLPYLYPATRNDNNTSNTSTVFKKNWHPFYFCDYSVCF